jgi:hypothetical protein
MVLADARCNDPHPRRYFDVRVLKTELVSSVLSNPNNRTIYDERCTLRGKTVGRPFAVSRNIARKPIENDR